MLQLEPAQPPSQGIFDVRVSEATKAADCQASSGWRQPLPSALAPRQPVAVPSFQPWLEHSAAAATPPVVFEAQVPCSALAGVQVALENSALWAKFHASGNEMIITRPGRRMFPVLRVTLSGMEPDSYYMLLLDMVPADEFRYRFLGNCWLPVQPAESAAAGPASANGGEQTRLYLHEQGPVLGAHWMLKPVDFSAVKLTNHKGNGAQQMVVQSMRKYVPRIHVFAGSDVQRLDYRRFKTFLFPETSFFAVTTYQNEQIIALKIQNNPYARSFFSNGERRGALKRVIDEDSASDEETTGLGSKQRQVNVSNSCGTSRSSPPCYISGSATAAERRLASSCSSQLAGYSAVPPVPTRYPCPYSTPSLPCLGPYPPYSTCLPDWCSPLYNYGRQHYGYAAAAAAAAAASVAGPAYAPSTCFSPSAPHVLPPAFLPGLGGGQTVSAMPAALPALSPSSVATMPPSPSVLPKLPMSSANTAPSQLTGHHSAH